MLAETKILVYSIKYAITCAEESKPPVPSPAESGGGDEEGPTLREQMLAASEGALREKKAARAKVCHSANAKFSNSFCVLLLKISIVLQFGHTHAHALVNVHLFKRRRRK